MHVTSLHMLHTYRNCSLDIQRTMHPQAHCFANANDFPVQITTQLSCAPCLQCTHFCMDCSNSGALCSCCLSEHSNCRTLQVRSHGDIASWLCLLWLFHCCPDCFNCPSS